MLIQQRRAFSFTGLQVKVTANKPTSTDSRKFWRILRNTFFRKIVSSQMRNQSVTAPDWPFTGIGTCWTHTRLSPPASDTKSKARARKKANKFKSSNLPPSISWSLASNYSKASVNIWKSLWMILIWLSSMLASTLSWITVSGKKTCKKRRKTKVQLRKRKNRQRDLNHSSERAQTRQWTRLIWQVLINRRTKRNLEGIAILVSLHRRNHLKVDKKL